MIQRMVVCEVPEAGLSVNDKTTDSDEVYFKTKVHIYNKQINQTVYLTSLVRTDHLPSRGGLRDWTTSTVVNLIWLYVSKLWLKSHNMAYFQVMYDSRLVIKV